MKNYLKISIITSMVLLSVSCGKNEKNLTCTQKIQDGVTLEMSSKYVDDAYQSGTVQMAFDLSSLTDSEKETLKNADICSALKESYNQITNCKQKSNSKEISATADYNIFEAVAKEASSDTIVKFNIDDTKSYLEDSGFSCTIK